jgi:hypothetical protein
MVTVVTWAWSHASLLPATPDPPTSMFQGSRPQPTSASLLPFLTYLSSGELSPSPALLTCVLCPKKGQGPDVLSPCGIPTQVKMQWGPQHFLPPPSSICPKGFWLICLSVYPLDC